NVGLNLYMIPAYGAWGATVATLVTQGLVALAHIVVATRQFNFKIEAKEILKLSAYTIIAVAGVYAVRYVPVHWFVQMCLGGVVCGIAILALQIIPISGLMAIVKSKATS
ncbi:MAG: polysaccharide biosynthesis C-terminal domain-containing protein, partial [Bacteroidetes bacterium]|nr:polysaccharide biosynthesis C-terminal domain-containing protein [Bacteroidota bacterium]